jgi:transcriptional regulator with GAF, ATPase, and Fis domain
MILSGALIGITYRIGFSTGSFSESVTFSYLEILLGYLLGWALIIWGLIQWAGDHFDPRGRVLINASAKWIRERVSLSLIEGQGPNQLLDGVTEDLLNVLSCQAVSLHLVKEDSSLHLYFHRGLVSASADLIENPKGKDNLYCASRRTAQAMITDGDHELVAGAILQTSDGPVATAICVPVGSGGKTLAIFTAYRTQPKGFDGDDLNHIRTVCNGLSASLRTDVAEKNHRLETRYKEMLLLAARPFDNGESLISALIKSAKLVHGYVPFSQIDLYIHDNGKPHSLEFNLPTGGTVTVKTGYFAERDYPEFHGEASESGRYRYISQDVLIHDNRKSYLFPICDGKYPLAHLKIELSAPAGGSTYLPLLGAALSRKISEHLKNDKVVKLQNQSQQWLGALQYYQDRAISTKNLSRLLNDLALLIVDLTPSTFCRILLADRDRKVSKTAALAQNRDLRWPANNAPVISLSDIALHRHALLDSRNIRFGYGDSEHKISSEEYSMVFPSGIKHGLIVPLSMGEKTVGLLTVGESRCKERSSLAGGASMFILSVARVISMALTLHREKWVTRSAIKGSRKLTLRQRHAPRDHVQKEIGLSVNSRINGPLAGIMASCEYLSSSPPADVSEVNRFIDIIQRNAKKIHSITAGAGAKNRS